MATIKYSPTAVPLDAPQGTRAWLDEQMSRLAVLTGALVDAAQPGGANTELQFNDSGAFGGAARLRYVNGALRILDAGLTDYLQAEHNSANFFLSLVNTANLQITGLTDAVDLLAGTALRIRDATNADSATFSHDGTDFVTSFTSTAAVKWNNATGPYTFSTSSGQAFAITSTHVSGPYVTLIDGGTPFADFGAGAQFGGGFGANDLAIVTRAGSQLSLGAGGTTTPHFTINTSGHLIVPGDNQELRFGVGNDGQIYSDGTHLNINVPTNAVTFFRINGASILQTGADGISVNSVIYQQERASAAADFAGLGQLWVKNTTPCQLWFTDDAGNDTQIV